MWPGNRLTSLFGIDLPIVQAPMAGASSLDMALAVSEAGGLGSLACATLDEDGLRQTLAEARQKTGRPLNVNFFAHAESEGTEAAHAPWLRRLSGYFRESGAAPPARLVGGPIMPFDDSRCAVIEEMTPAVVSFHFGLPRADLVSRIRAAGAKIVSTATTVGEARWLEDHGCDAVIAQGWEAGGHRGMFLTEDIHTQTGTLALVPLVADAVVVPVIAAGGIADGRGVAAALALGAAAVQIGTAYLFTREAAVGALHDAALRTAGLRTTALTNLFSGRPARCLVNRAMREIGPMAGDVPAFPAGFGAMAPLRAKAEAAGRDDFSALYCGQAAALGRSGSAADLTRDLAASAQRRIAAMVVGASG